MRTLFRVLLIASMAALPFAARAEVIVYTALLSGPAESPPNASPGTGTATVTVNAVALTVRVQATFSGLLANTTAAHIHCCTADPFAGTVGVATQTPSFSGFPLGVTQGQMDVTFLLDQVLNTGFFNLPFYNANGATEPSALQALVAGMDSGRAYFNVHTTQFPGGEIRGFLVRQVAEPATLVLLGIGVLGLALVGQRRAVARRIRLRRR